MKQIATAVALSVLVSFSVQAQPTTTIEFTGMTAGQPPTDFDFARTGQGEPGRWLGIDDVTTQTGSTLAQVSEDSTDYRFPLAIYKPFTAKDVEVTVRFKPVSGNVDQAGGIAIRLTTPDDYYVVRANALEDNVRLYRVVKGEREELAGANIKVASNQWHTLGLKANGDRFTVSLDDKDLYTAQDGTFSAPGKVALWTKADSVTYFEAFTVAEVQ